MTMTETSLHLATVTPRERSRDFWQYFHRNGELKAEGHLINGEKDGKWRYFTSDGLLESVENYSGGVLNGDYISYHPTGRLNAVGTFVNGQVEGKVTWHNIFGIPTRTLIYKRDTLDGEARTFYSSSQPMEVYHK
jgi:antitoxin component YwqK of YwqJK toxin-antitoxin module